MLGAIRIGIRAAVALELGALARGRIRWCRRPAESRARHTARAIASEPSGSEKSIMTSILRSAGKDELSAHAERGNRRQAAGVLTEMRMSGPIDGRAELELGIARDELHQPRSHPAGRTMDADGENRLSGSIHRTINSFRNVERIQSDSTATGDGSVRRVEGDRADDVVQIVGHHDWAIGETRPEHASRSQHLIELSLVGAVVGDRGRGVLELMPGQDAHHAVRRGDHALFPQPLGSGDAGGAGGLAAQPSGPHPGLRIHDFLVRYHAHHAVAKLQSSQALFEIHRAIDLDRGCDRGRFDLLRIELPVVGVDLVHFRKTVSPPELRVPTSSLSVWAPVALITARRGTREINPR